MADEKNCCGVCSKQLTTLELALIDPKDFTRTCKEHKQYARTFQLWKVKKELGFAHEEPAHNCTICGAALSDKEWRDVDVNSFQLTCAKHRQYKGAFSSNAVREKLGI